MVFNFALLVLAPVLGYFSNNWAIFSNLSVTMTPIYLFVVGHQGLDGAELEHDVGPDDLPSRLALEGGMVVKKGEV
jgi:hypothetical protein